jgi:hypothetical protein
VAGSPGYLSTEITNARAPPDHWLALKGRSVDYRPFDMPFDHTNDERGGPLCQAEQCDGRQGPVTETLVCSPPPMTVTQQKC